MDFDPSDLVLGNVFSGCGSLFGDFPSRKARVTSTFVTTQPSIQNPTNIAVVFKLSLTSSLDKTPQIIDDVDITLACDSRLDHMFLSYIYPISGW